MLFLLFSVIINNEQRTKFAWSTRSAYGVQYFLFTFLACLWCMTNSLIGLLDFPGPQPRPLSPAPTFFLIKFESENVCNNFEHKFFIVFSKSEECLGNNLNKRSLPLWSLLNFYIHSEFSHPLGEKAWGYCDTSMRLSSSFVSCHRRHEHLYMPINSLTAFLYSYTETCLDIT